VEAFLTDCNSSMEELPTFIRLTHMKPHNLFGVNAIQLRPCPLCPLCFSLTRLARDVWVHTLFQSAFRRGCDVTKRRRSRRTPKRQRFASTRRSIGPRTTIRVLPVFDFIVPLRECRAFLTVSKSRLGERSLRSLAGSSIHL